MSWSNITGYCRWMSSPWIICSQQRSQSQQEMAMNWRILLFTMVDILSSDCMSTTMIMISARNCNELEKYYWLLLVDVSSLDYMFSTKIMISARKYSELE